MGTLDFSAALAAIKDGRNMRRRGWNGRGMHVYLEDARQMTVGAGAFRGAVRRHEAHLVLFNGTTHQPGWVPSQADLLAEDWEVA